MRNHTNTSIAVSCIHASRYRPRRANQRWLEDAPEYVLDVFDNKGATYDRYSVLFGGSLLEPMLLQERKVFVLDMSPAPSHPLGVSMWGECSASWRPAHRRIRWLDLPDVIRNHVKARAEHS
jgi:hypothetical protein